MLIKCPECGKEISDRAASCPNCGCPQSAWTVQASKAGGISEAVQAFLDGRKARGASQGVIESFRDALDGFDRYLVGAGIGIEGLDERVIAEYIRSCAPGTDTEGLIYRLNAFSQYSGIDTTENGIRALVLEKPRCPYCGSESYLWERKGFGAGKAVAGALIAGPIGLAAGAIGSRKARRRCQNCGRLF